MAKSWYKISNTQKEFWGWERGEGKSNTGARIPDQVIPSLVTENVPCLAFVTVLFAHSNIFT